MGKAIRKPRPSVAHYYWYDTDGCWNCPSNKRYRACSGCKMLKRYNHAKDKANRHHNKQRLKAERM